MRIVEHPSPNAAMRAAGAVVDVLVLHYTELPLRQSLDVLCDPARAHRVSAHYVLAEDQAVYRLVPEDRVAWHAGKSWWRGREALNATSIGIEIVNLHGDRHDYPEGQIAALVALCRGIVARHPAIVPRNVVGHSDIAPERKIDPGLRFPWRRLAGEGLGLWPHPSDRPVAGDFQEALQRFGYAPPVEASRADIARAFQRHYRPVRVDGVVDEECRALLADLLDQAGERA